MIATGSIGETGINKDSRTATAKDFSLSIVGLTAGEGSVSLVRRAPGDNFIGYIALELEDATDRLLTEAGDLLLMTATGQDQWRTYATYTADAETVITVAGETEFALDCTSYVSGEFEFRLWN